MGTYSRLEDILESHYGSRGIDITVDPRGRGMPDIVGHDADGNAFVGEIKSSVEAGGSASSWWSYWSAPGRDLRANYDSDISQLSAEARGWCAVIDGQLRKYCLKFDILKGDLIVEDGISLESAIDQALAFLKSENRIAGWQAGAAGSLVIRTVVFC